ncbi:type II toxin-antitoxin system HigB family toxin [Azospirillum sp. TSO22-1]|uniref:type II toxin-antitoxin system HigB family toxin n=1 Tax=Azospirillum sp. TSO22-1 TaxID=716789 RepID=UPI000D64DFCC|nr:type II toxin-antitoxin system HigB family toxin [Azospirillum sp. TSO22-1]
MRDWFNIVKASDWAGTAAVKAQFRSVSFVGECVVFNIAGNKYRLVAYVSYQWRTVYIRFVGTHAESDALNRSGKLESI